jgi:hypothetical protein
MAACDLDEEWFKQKYKVFYYWLDDDLDDGDDSSWDSYYYNKWAKENTYGESFYDGLKTNEEDGVKYYYNDSEEAAVPVEATDIDERINEMAKTLRLITTEVDEGGVETPDTSKFDEFKAANTAYNKVVKDKGIDPENDTYHLDERGIETARGVISNKNTQIADYNKTIADNSYWDQKNYTDYYDEQGNLDVSELASSITSNGKSYGSSYSFTKDKISIPVSSISPRTSIILPSDLFIDLSANFVIFATTF